MVDGNNVVYDQLQKHRGDRAEIGRLEVLIRQLSLVFQENTIVVVVSAALRHTADDPGLLENLIRSGQVTMTPAGTADDFFIIQKATSSGYMILTNDRFNDWKDKYPVMAKQIDDSRVSYVWIQKTREFQFSEKFSLLLRRNVDLSGGT